MDILEIKPAFFTLWSQWKAYNNINTIDSHYLRLVPRVFEHRSTRSHKINMDFTHGLRHRNYASSFTCMFP